MTYPAFRPQTLLNSLPFSRRTLEQPVLCSYSTFATSSTIKSVKTYHEKQLEMFRVFSLYLSKYPQSFQHDDLPGIFVPPTFFRVFQPFYPLLPVFFWCVLSKTSTNSTWNWNQSMQVSESGLHYRSWARGRAPCIIPHARSMISRNAGLLLANRSVAVSRQIHTAHSCS